MFKYLLLTTTLLFCYISVEAAEVNCQMHHCVAIVDAGSSKSYLHVYQYELDSTKTPIQEIGSKRVTPGLASVEVQKLPEYLTTLMAGMPDPSIPVYIYATAGMRLLPKDNQESIYQAMRQWFSSHSPYHLKQAKTISGKEEGVFGWLAMNYQQNKFTSNDDAYAGVIDMGGASVQIVMPVTETSQLNPRDVASVSVNGKTIQLFVHSFLGLGQTEVTHQLMDEPACYTQSYPLAGESLVGTGQWQTCEDKMNLILQLHDVTSIVSPSLAANTTNEWYVMGGISSLFRKPAFKITDEQAQVSDLSEKGYANFCETTWETLKATDPTDTYLPFSCLSTTYFHALLTKGYGFQEQQTVKFTRTEAAEGWTLGTVIQKANML